jgi:hypothetical protein
MTFWKALSGCVSSFSPQVAPALAKRMSTRSVCFLTCSRSDSTPAMVELSAGTEMATAPGERLGWALRALQASSQALALREEMKTLDAPAWRKLLEVGLAMLRLEGGRDLGYLRGRGVQAQTPGAARNDGHLALEGEEGGEVLKLGLGHGGRLGAEEGGKGSQVGWSVGFRQGRGVGGAVSG